METGIPFVIGAVGTILKRLVNGLEHMELIGQVESIQTIALLKSARILRRMLKNWGDVLLL